MTDGRKTIEFKQGIYDDYSAVRRGRLKHKKGRCDCWIKEAGIQMKPKEIKKRY